MKPVEGRQPSSLAAQLMAIEIVSELLVSTSPLKLGEALTEQLRELTGAKTVMVVAHHPTAEAVELLHVSPKRRAAFFTADEIGVLFLACAREKALFLTDELPADHRIKLLLGKNGMASLARYPFRVGGELIGGLLLFDLPELDRFTEINHIIRLLSAPIALALKNALSFRQIEQQALELERRVQERTSALLEKNVELLRSEEAIRKSAYEFRMLAESMPQIVWICSPEGLTVYFNRQWVDYTGLSLKESLGQGWIKPFHPEDRQRAWDAWQDAVRRGEGYELECRLRRADGVYKWWLNRGVPVVDADGVVSKWFGTSTDIDELKRAQEEKLALESQLQQAQKMESVGRLAGGVAHDFNNMLSIIIGYGQISLMESGLSPQLRDNLEEMQKAAQRSADLTRQLLAFARKQTIAPKVQDLNETVASMSKMMKRLIGEDINLRWLPSGDLWRVYVDPSQIDQILANLCVNARDSITGVGEITIETANRIVDDDYCAHNAGAVPGEYVRLAVSDNGCGMGRETRARIFEPFFTTKGVGEGTGLGLATVYGIVKQNNGYIDVYSEPGLGTTFSIFFPRHEGKGAAAPNESADSAPRGLETILLVEDETAILNIFEMILARQGYRVLAAGSPAEALRLAREHDGEIHLLMTDVIMPEMNGRDLAREVVTLHPRIKRLFMSGYTADVIAHQGALEEGVNFIHKPFPVQKLALKVREVLDG